MVHAPVIGQHNLILVAHPDDEVLWAGGLPIRYSEHALFHIVCCSVPRRDPVRAWKFFDACYTLNALPRILPFLETEVGSPLFGLEALGDFPQFDCIITHGEEGEYGHSHHRSVHEYARSIRKGRKFLTFSYEQRAEGTFNLMLNEEEAERKMQALRCYNHTLPYEGVEMTKAQALLHRYFESQGRDFSVESYAA